MNLVDLLHSMVAELAAQRGRESSNPPAVSTIIVPDILLYRELSRDLTDPPLRVPKSSRQKFSTQEYVSV